ncbi:protein-disulfide reductase DsbD domain-containing protein [Sinorhizobium sp. CB9]
MTPWVSGEGGRMRLVALNPDATGRIKAALQIEPKPGWITYWREPGNSGIPPQVTVTGSDIRLERVDYPVPKILSDGKVEDIGYDAPVALPLTFIATEPSKPAKIEATAFIGICKDICIPFQAEFSLTLAPVSQSLPEEETILQSAAALPESPSIDFAVRGHQLSSDGKQLSLQLTVPESGSALPEVIVTGPSGHVFFKQENGRRDGKLFETNIAIGKLPKNYDIHGKTWGLVVIDGKRAMETTLAFD